MLVLLCMFVRRSQRQILLTKFLLHLLPHVCKQRIFQFKLRPQFPAVFYPWSPLKVSYWTKFILPAFLYEELSLSGQRTRLKCENYARFNLSCFHFVRKNTQLWTQVAICDVTKGHLYLSKGQWPHIPTQFWRRPPELLILLFGRLNRAAVLAGGWS